MLGAFGLPSAAANDGQRTTPGLAQWRPPAVPYGDDIKSVEILGRDEPIRTRPDTQAPRRGSAARGAHLPLLASDKGPGCEGRWFLVGPLAWICEDNVRLSPIPPIAPATPHRSFEHGLPMPYYFVNAEGTSGYAKLSLAEEQIPDAQLEQGFAVAIRQVANKRHGDPFGLTTHGLWLPMRDLHPVRPLAMRGQDLDGRLDVAWIIDDDVLVHAEPGGRRISSSVERFDVHRVQTRRRHAGTDWIELEGVGWVRARHMRTGDTASPPPSLRANERWIDVDTANQILTAYEGDRPVFATLVSTGRGQGESELATPKGEHRVWVKLNTSDMTNLEDAEASRYYAIQDVPWVMYFKKGYGVHGAFWHRSFGRVRSHGCVNLTPLAAQHLFEWANPRLPAGWTAVLPTQYDPGSIVRVR